MVQLFANNRKVCIFAPSLFNGRVVQLVRIHACHAWGRGFEPRPDRQNTMKALLRRGVFFCTKISGARSLSRMSETNFGKPRPDRQRSFVLRSFFYSNMSHFVYIIYSQKLELRYKGHTENISQKAE